MRKAISKEISFSLNFNSNRSPIYSNTLNVKSSCDSEACYWHSNGAAQNWQLNDLSAKG